MKPLTRVDTAVCRKCGDTSPHPVMATEWTCPTCGDTWKKRAANVDVLVERLMRKLVGGLSVHEARRSLGPYSQNMWPSVWRRCVQYGAMAEQGILFVDEEDPQREHDRDDCERYGECLSVAAKSDAPHVCIPGCHKYRKAHLIPEKCGLKSSLGQIETLQHEPREDDVDLRGLNKAIDAWREKQNAQR